MTMTWFVGDRHRSETINERVNEKVNPRTQKIVEVIKGTCSIFDRNLSQMFTE